MRDAQSILYGKNAVLEALRRDTPIEKLFVREGRGDAQMETLLREAKRKNVRITFVSRTRLDQLSQTDPFHIQLFRGIFSPNKLFFDLFCNTCDCANRMIYHSSPVIIQHHEFIKFIDLMVFKVSELNNPVITNTQQMH